MVRSAPSAIARSVIAALLVYGVMYAAIVWFQILLLISLTQLIVGFVIYCLIGFFVTPEPDISNMGYETPWGDNLYRVSDDFNRGLAYIKVLLYPGTFVLASLIELFLAFHTWRIS